MFYFFLFVFQILNLAPNIKKELAKNESSKRAITFNIPISSTKNIANKMQK